MDNMIRIVSTRTDRVHHSIETTVVGHTALMALTAHPTDLPTGHLMDDTDHRLTAPGVIFRNPVLRATHLGVLTIHPPNIRTTSIVRLATAIDRMLTSNPFDFETIKNIII